MAFCLKDYSLQRFPGIKLLKTEEPGDIHPVWFMKDPNHTNWPILQKLIPIFNLNTYKLIASNLRIVFMDFFFIYY